MTAKHGLSYFDGVDDDDDLSPDGWFDDFVRALSVYVSCRPEQVTVRSAGDAFHVEDAVIARAVEDNYWLFVTGPSDDPTKQVIEMEGI